MTPSTPSQFSSVALRSGMSFMEQASPPGPPSGIAASNASSGTRASTGPPSGIAASNASSGTRASTGPPSGIVASGLVASMPASVPGPRKQRSAPSPFARHTHVGSGQSATLVQASTPSGGSTLKQPAPLPTASITTGKARKRPNRFVLTRASIRRTAIRTPFERVRNVPTG
jgi:hypothetical protein